jgi:HlyD family secretion protein
MQCMAVAWLWPKAANSSLARRNKFLPASPRRPTRSHAADQSGLAAFESRKPACSSTMSKSTRPNKARPWLKNPLPWLKNALPWLWSDDSISKHIRYGSALVAILVFGFGGWAAIGKISGAVIAQGSVAVDSNVKKVQHPTGGVVGQIYVQDGDHVTAGQLLIRLDETASRADLEIVRKALDELYARKARLGAELDGADAVGMPPALADTRNDTYVKDALASERKLFEARRQARLGKQDQLKQHVGQLDEEVTGLNAQKQANDKELALIEQELEGTRDLWTKKLVPLNRLTTLEGEEARLQGQGGQLIASAAATKDKIAETQLQILQIDQDFAADVAKELRETDSKIGEDVERKVAAEDRLKRTDIRAPQDGIVFQSTANTIGGVITTGGDPIMLIVPESDQMTVEVKIDPKDIEQIRLGQPAVLRFSAFDKLWSSPEVNGAVSRIAADTSTDQRTGQSYYLVRIAMRAESLGELKLTPGMPVEAFIQTGERTLISYLVKPLHDQLLQAYRQN